MTPKHAADLRRVLENMARQMVSEANVLSPQDDELIYYQLLGLSTCLSGMVDYLDKAAKQ